MQQAAPVVASQPVKGNHCRILEQSSFSADKKLKIELKLNGERWICSSVLLSRRISGSDNDNSPAKEDQLSFVAGIEQIITKVI